MQRLSNQWRVLLCAGAILAGSAGSSFGLSLPPPGGTIDGVYYNIVYDDFVSYSNQILMAIQKKSPTLLPVSTYGAFDFATGTGGLDVILYTGAGTKDRNVGVGPGKAFTFEDPVSAPGGGKTSGGGWWGQGDQDNDPSTTKDNGLNGPVTVGQVLDYLHALNRDNNVPVFYMDMNQVAGAQALTISGEVMLIDPTTRSVVHSWSLDSAYQPGDGSYDPAFPAVTTPEIPTLIGTSGTDYGPIDHSVGSGKADFIAFAPTMDLSRYDRDLLFVTNFSMGMLSDGFEEIFLTGLIVPPSQPVPEPSTIVLLGGALAALGLYGRRSRK